MNFNFSVNKNLLKPKNNEKFEPSALPEYEYSGKKEPRQTYCVGGRRKSKTNDIIEYEKRNPKTNKVRKGKYDICGRSKSQSFAT